MSSGFKLKEDGFEVSELKGFNSNRSGGKWHLVVCMKSKPVPVLEHGLVEHKYHIGYLPFDSIETASNFAGKYRGRDDVMMIKIVPVKD